MYLTDGDTLRLLASKGPTPDPVRNVDVLPINRESLSGRAVLEQRTIQVPDLLAAGADYPLSHDIAERLGHRTVVVTPLYREGKPFGTILLRRHRTMIIAPLIREGERSGRSCCVGRTCGRSANAKSRCCGPSPTRR